jgi:surface-anchored protein
MGTLMVCLILAVANVKAKADSYDLDLHLHSTEVIPQEFAPNDALLPVVAATKTTRPAGSQFDFIGTASGSAVWLLPKSQTEDVLFLSIGTEELNPSDFSSLITLTLQSVTGPNGGSAPGVFSIWNVDNFGGIVPLMSTADGASTPNALSVNAGSHNHFNYAFTAPGLYNVEFAASATLAAGLGGGPVSGVATYSFGVFDTGSDYQQSGTLPWTYQGQEFSLALYGDEHIDIGVGLAVVPEPSSIALAGLGVAGLAGAALRRRMRKQ